jgi:mRNA interferase YafQ
MYSIEATHQFKKDLRLCVKRGLNPDLIAEAIAILEEKGTLPATYKPHLLKGDYKGLWECHIKSDWLLIWKQEYHKTYYTTQNRNTFGLVLIFCISVLCFILTKLTFKIKI